MIVFLISALISYVLYFAFEYYWCLIVFPLSALGCSICWECWKSKVRKLEDEIEKLKRSDT